MPRFWSFRLAYVGLWLVRVWFALYGMGYIHPDEYMQNGEVTAGNILGFHALTTWEWQTDFPVRSVLPTFATTGLPLFVLRLLSKSERHPYFVFRLQRLAFLCLSAVLDYSVFDFVSQPASRRLSLLLLASSYVVYTFQARPFSNAIESVLVSLCLVLLRRIVDKQTPPKWGGKNTKNRNPRFFRSIGCYLHFLAAVAVVGVFTRPTFIAFTLPIAFQILRHFLRVAGSPFGVITLLFPPLCTAVLMASVFIAADTYYFGGDFSELVITPYNFVRYNLSANNLADHGLHPKWLHIGVNLPLLLGPLLVRYAWCGIYHYLKPSNHRLQKVHFEPDIRRQTLIHILVVSLFILSIQPHQEPRFLIPLVPLFIMLAATAKLLRPGMLFWASWITFNTLLALVFGIFHQGGVVPSLLSLHSTLRNLPAGSSAHIVYWKTYMPPRHLLGVSRQDVASGNFSFTDLSGRPPNELMAVLSASSIKSTYLVTPVPMYSTIPRDVSSCMILEERIWPHLDLDHVQESIQAGWYNGTSLGIYAVDYDCLPATGTNVT